MGRGGLGPWGKAEALTHAETATTIHVIPDVPDCREVKLARTGHSFTRRRKPVGVDEDRDGFDSYWFDLTRWQSGEMEPHILGKINGQEAAARIHERLDD